MDAGVPPVMMESGTSTMLPLSATNLDFLDLLPAYTTSELYTFSAVSHIQGCRFGAMAPKMASSEKLRRWVNFRRQCLSLFQFLAC